MSNRINPQHLSSFLNYVRGCGACKTLPCKNGSICIPAVYGKPTSDIFVVSDNPPRTVWQDNLGEKWIRSLGVVPGKRGMTSMLAEWLEFDNAKADNRFFWIHMANCFPEDDLKDTWKFCSEKFIKEALLLVNPKAIITLGVNAANYFFGVQLLKNHVRRFLSNGLNITINRQSYACIPFSHPSWRVDRWRRDNAGLHYNTMVQARKLV